MKPASLARIAILATLLVSAIALAQENPFLGQWALTPEGGGAGWLDVRLNDGGYEGVLLWMGGSPEPMARVYFDGGTLCAYRQWPDEIRDETGKLIKSQPQPAFLTATLADGKMTGVYALPSRDGASVFKQTFSGVAIPPAPPKPDLTAIKYGDPITLFNGKDLEGWAVLGGPHWSEIKSQKPGASATAGWVPKDEGVANGWYVKDGILINDPVQHEGQPHIRYGNLTTLQAFEDFNLTLEVKVLPGGNSGIYLRGIYEVQVVDSHAKPLDCHNMGAIYGRITPLEAAEKPAGQWQTLDITLINRHATVKLNGKTIIDNQPLPGCTGGALWADQSIPGPIYFQGDHTGVEYRNIILRPIAK